MCRKCMSIYIRKKGSGEYPLQKESAANKANEGDKKEYFIEMVLPQLLFLSLSSSVACLISKGQSVWRTS